MLCVTNMILHSIDTPVNKKGRAAVVLPDGFFFGEGMKTRLKEKLLSECNLHTIVRLPNGVFNPYTGIKTNTGTNKSQGNGGAA